MKLQQSFLPVLGQKASWTLSCLYYMGMKMGTDFPTGMKGPPILAVWVIALCSTLWGSWTLSETFKQKDLRLMPSIAVCICNTNKTV